MSNPYQIVESISGVVRLTGEELNEAFEKFKESDDIVRGQPLFGITWKGECYVIYSSGRNIYACVYNFDQALPLEVSNQLSIVVRALRNRLETQVDSDDEE